jgi:hypothetical protein
MINLWLDFLAADLSFYFESEADNPCPEWGVTQFDSLLSFSQVGSTKYSLVLLTGKPLQ